MSTLSVTTISTANGTTDLTLTTGNTSGPVIVVGANGSLTYSNVSSFSVGTLTVVGNTTISNTLTVVGNTTISNTLTVVGNTTISNGNLIINGNNVSPFQSFRNKIINGNFDIWQRGTSTSTSNAYCADRFKSESSGTTFTTSRQSFTLGQTDVPNEPTYYHRTVVTSVAGASNYCLIGQPIESVSTLANNTVTVSFWAKADASKNIAMEFLQNFGTGGSPSANVNTIGVTTCALTTTWTKFIIPVEIPSISGKTIGTNNNDYLAVYFWLNAGSTFNARTNSLGQASGTYEFSQLQIEKGTVATPFEMRPLATELNLCHRYCQYMAGMNIYATSGTFGSYSPDFYFPVSLYTNMRATPTFTRSSVSDSGVTVTIGGNVGVFYVGFEMTSAVSQSQFNLLITAEL